MNILFYLKLGCLHEGVWGGSERGDGISGAKFYIMFNSNCGSILLSFRDMITRRTTETDGRTLASITYLVLNAGHQ